MSQNTNDYEFNESSLGIHTFLLVLLAIAVGILAAAILLPDWLPNLASSLLGSEPKCYWYLSRGSAFVAMGLLWISMALGLMITNKMARLWPGGPAAFAIHEFTSLLGLAFAAFHGIVLLGDQYINFDIAKILIPFASGYQPFWVGLGQVGLYTWALLASTFYVRRWLGHKTWRFIHFSSFFIFLMALMHGLNNGTDTSTIWVQRFYWLTGGSLLFLFIYRVIASLDSRLELKAVVASSQGATEM